MKSLGIGSDPANVQTDLARIELLQSELDARRNALEKLRGTASDKFPLKQKRLAAISENLSKIGSIAKTKHDMMRNKMKQLENSNNKKKIVQKWAQEVAEMLVNDGPYRLVPLQIY